MNCLSLRNLTDGSAASILSLSRIGIHTIVALMSAWLKFLIIVSCNARTPWSRHKGHVGERRERNRIFSLLSLNWFLSGSKELSRVIILLDWMISIKQVLSNIFFQLSILKELMPFSLSTTWRTSAKHHLPFGFLLAQSQPPIFFSAAIFFMITDRSFLMKSCSISSAVYPKQ